MDLVDHLKAHDARIYTGYVHRVTPLEFEYRLHADKLRGSSLNRTDEFDTLKRGRRAPLILINYGDTSDSVAEEVYDGKTGIMLYGPSHRAEKRQGILQQFVNEQGLKMAVGTLTRNILFRDYTARCKGVESTSFKQEVVGPRLRNLSRKSPTIVLHGEDTMEVYSGVLGSKLI